VRAGRDRVEGTGSGSPAAGPGAAAASAGGSQPGVTAASGCVAGPGRHPVVTIDGPAGAGKSTVARRLAERLGFGFLPSGAIYRAVAWRVAQGAALEPTLGQMRIEFRGTPTRQRVLVDGEDVTEALAGAEVGALASALSQRPEVRAYADAVQRAHAARGPLVVEGRDAGTVVFPRATCKFFLDASFEERARRRFAELRARGEAVTLEAVRAALAARDEADRRRPLAPLVVPPDARRIDSSGLGIDEVVERMAQEVERLCCTRC
jgi:cytidylate kinase